MDKDSKISLDIKQAIEQANNYIVESRPGKKDEKVSPPIYPSAKVPSGWHHGKRHQGKPFKKKSKILAGSEEELAKLKSSKHLRFKGAGPRGGWDKNKEVVYEPPRELSETENALVDKTCTFVKSDLVKQCKSILSNYILEDTDEEELDKMGDGKALELLKKVFSDWLENQNTRSMVKARGLGGVLTSDTKTDSPSGAPKAKVLPSRIKGAVALVNPAGLVLDASLGGASIGDAKVDSPSPAPKGKVLPSTIKGATSKL